MKERMEMVLWQMRRRLSVTAASAFLIFSTMTGCCWRCGAFKADHCADHPCGAIPAPVGTYSCQWQLAQQDRAELDDFVFYEAEWYRGGSDLGPKGKEHLAAIAKRVAAGEQQIVIEPHHDHETHELNSELNYERVAHVVNQLSELGVIDAQDRVVIGRSIAEPLLGTEGARVGTSRLQGTRGGVGGGGGSAGISGQAGAAGGQASGGFRGAF
jgi:hypothetical protein